MPIQLLPAGKMNLDKGPTTGDHLWMAKDVVYTESGYEKLESWLLMADATVSANHVVRGAHTWYGANPSRVYCATNAKFFEFSDSGSTDVTGTTPTNSTNGVTFASYGEWCFAANGVDEIQTIKVPSALGASTNFEDMVYTTGGAKIAPKYICSHKNHIVAANIKFLESYGEIASHTTAVGGAFVQPAGDTIQVLSSDVAEVAGAGKYVTVYGTYTGGGDTVRAETILINGTTAVDSAYSNWQLILGTNCSFTPVAASTLTVRKKTGAVTITTFTTAAGAGIDIVAAADQAGGDRVLDIVPVSPGTSTKQIGVIGTTPGGVVFWDSQALNGTATVQTNSDFRAFTHVLTGDLENTITVTVSSHQYPANYVDPYLVWWSGTDDPEGYGTEVLAPQIVGSSNQPLLDGVGKITGVADGGDCFFVFKQGSIHRFDGPPFQPSIISSSVGMAHGNVPYRQGDRVYFWSLSGLHYIDINSNQVVNVMHGAVRKAVTESEASGGDSVRAEWPKSRLAGPTVSSTARSVCNGVASIAGDPLNRLVFVIYYASNSAVGGTNGLIYHEDGDMFTAFSGPVTLLDGSTYTYGRLGTKLVSFQPDDEDLSMDPPGMGSMIRCVAQSDAVSTISFYSLDDPTFHDDTVNDCYFLWPFMSSPANAGKSRVTRVRPLFDNPSNVGEWPSSGIKVSVISISGTKKNWSNGVLSAGETTVSNDGWIMVDNCPSADKHSVGISMLAPTLATGSGCMMTNFTGVEVEYQDSVSKSI